MATIVVWNPNGAFIDGLHEHESDPLDAPGLTQAILTSGGNNTGGTLRITATVTEGTDGRDLWVVGANGV